MIICIDKAMVLKDRHGDPVGRLTLRAEDETGTVELALVKKISPRRACFSGGKWRADLSWEEAPDDFAKICLSVSGRSGAGKLKRIFLKLASSAGGGALARGARSLFIGTGMNNPDGVFSLAARRTNASSLLALAFNPSSAKALLAGIGAPAEDFSEFKAYAGGLEAGFAPMMSLRAARRYEIVMAEGSDPFSLLETYGGYLARCARKNQEICTGWNSWDYYGGAVSMRDILSELDAINASPLKNKLKYCAIDMGWACAWGDWNPNRKFPADFKDIAGAIRKKGFVPGIWFAPLQCSIYTGLARFRQDLFIKSAAGSPEMFKEGVLLDFTLPEVQDMLRGWFGAARRAGFELFKIDYIYKNYLQKIEQAGDPARGRAGMVRAGLGAIRDAVGDDAHILNCGAPAEAALGLVDSSRVSVDIHAFWGHVRHNAAQIAVKLWQNGRLWTIDPDFALARSAATSSDRFLNYVYQKQPLQNDGNFWMAGEEASFSELQTLLALVHIAGGNVFVADSIRRLNRRGIRALSRLFPPLQGGTTALDLFADYETAPRFWANRSGALNRLAIFNWDDHPRPIHVPRGVNLPARGRNLLTGRKVPVSSRTVMPARSALLLDI